MVDYEAVQKRIAANLRSLRSENGITQMQLAEYMGVSQGAVSKWMRAIVMPDLKSIVGLAELFGVTVSEIVGDVKSDKYENSIDKEKAE